ncbi:hypothetical protein VCLMA_A0897 [Vibrio cholerae LMA3984-4]|nr:hypothetical protein VCLMA_A0897 [Vibrio cholerae LMA3984-4]
MALQHNYRRHLPKYGLFPGWLLCGFYRLPLMCRMRRPHAERV